MNSGFSNFLKQVRINKGLSQQMLADRLFVTKATVARWEKGSRMPDAAMILKIAECLDIDVALLMNAIAEDSDAPHVIIVDDEKIILNGGIPILKQVMPDAEVTGFTKPSSAIEYAKSHKVDLALLDIEMGMTSGFDVCRELLKYNAKTNVIFLTAYTDYALDAWSTGASGFMLKPLTAEGIRAQLETLRYPISISTTAGGTAQ